MQLDKVFLFIIDALPINVAGIVFPMVTSMFFLPGQFSTLLKLEFLHM